MASLPFDHDNHLDASSEASAGNPISSTKFDDLMDQYDDLWNNTFQTHASRHQDGGSDEVEVDTLAGANGTDGQIITTDGSALSFSNASDLISGDDARDPLGLEGYLDPDGLTLANNSTDGDHDVDVTGGVVAVHDFSSNWRLVDLGDLTPGIQIDSTGAGGRLNSSALAADTWYEIGVIADSSGSKSVDVGIYQDGDRPTASSDLPTGYDLFRAMGTPGKTWWVKTDGTSNILGFRHDSTGNYQWTPATLTTFSSLENTTTFSSTDDSPVSIDISSQIPPAAINIFINRLFIETNANGLGQIVFGNNSTNLGIATSQKSFESGASSFAGSSLQIFRVTNQEIFRVLNDNTRFNQVIVGKVSNFKAVN